MTPLIGVAGLAGAGSLKSIQGGAENWFVKFRYQDDVYGSLQWGAMTTGIHLDSSGNIFYTGIFQGGHNFVSKWDSNGNYQWGVRLYKSSLSIMGVATDSLNNIYLVGYGAVSSHGNSGNELLTIKLNSSGVRQWARAITDSGSSSQYGWEIVVDSSDDIYVCGQTYHPTGSSSSGNSYYLYAKYNSSGAIQYQRYYHTQTGNGANHSAKAMVITGGTSGNDMWIGGSAWLYRTTDYGSYSYARTVPNLMQFNKSTGSPTGYSKIFYVPGEACNGRQDMAAYQNDVFYVSDITYTYNYSAYYSLLVTRHDSTGNEQWTRIIGKDDGGTTSNAANVYGGAIDVDSSGNVYVMGRTRPYNSYQDGLLIVKYNSSGVLQWQRTFDGAYIEQAQGSLIKHDNNGNFYIGFMSQTPEGGGQGNESFILAKLPDDGSKTGTHGVFTYAASSYDDQPRSSHQYLNYATPPSDADYYGTLNETNTISYYDGTTDLLEEHTIPSSTFNPTFTAIE